VALTLVPALAGRIPATREGLFRRTVNGLLERMQDGYAWIVGWMLKAAWLLPLGFTLLLILIWPWLNQGKEVFLPNMDEGRIGISITADRGINLEGMDRVVLQLEEMLAAQPEVETLFTQVGGFVFGRSEHEASNRATIEVTLRPKLQRGISSQAWIDRVKRQITEAKLVGVKIQMRISGIRGIRLNRGDDDLSLRLQGPDLELLSRTADQLVDQLGEIPGLRNLTHTSEDLNQEIALKVDRERAASFGLTVEDVGEILKLAMAGDKVTDFIEGDRSVDVRLRLNRSDLATPGNIESVIIFSRTEPRVPLRLGELASVELLPAPAEIHRDQQRRVVEISASLGDELTLQQALEQVNAVLQKIDLPEGYSAYEAGSLQTLQEGRDLGKLLLGLALFLVLVVMAVQYESLRNPLVIMFSVPFGVIGVAIGLQWSALPLSMPVWLGLIMLAGIVVNNAIVLVEYIGLQRAAGLALDQAIIEAARLRLRPILMTTLTTVAGMLPLAMALGEGAEMLQPLAITMVSGLLFSTLVTLLLIPSVYRLVGR
jgi:multidrug efflux pump subunit AcrB